MQSVMLVPITFGIVLAIFALVAFIVLVVRGHSNAIGVKLRVGWLLVVFLNVPGWGSHAICSNSTGENVTR